MIISTLLKCSFLLVHFSFSYIVCCHFKNEFRVLNNILITLHRYSQSVCLKVIRLMNNWGRKEVEVDRLWEATKCELRENEFWFMSLIFYTENICDLVNIIFQLVNPLPYDKFWDWSISKAFADYINITSKQKFFFGLVENIVGKGENAGYQHFLLYPQCFLKASCSQFLKVWIVWQRVKELLFSRIWDVLSTRAKFIKHSMIWLESYANGNISTLCN